MIVSLATGCSLQTFSELLMCVHQTPLGSPEAMKMLIPVLKQFIMQGRRQIGTYLPPVPSSFPLGERKDTVSDGSKSGRWRSPWHNSDPDTAPIRIVEFSEAELIPSRSPSRRWEGGGTQLAMGVTQRPPGSQ